MHFSDAARRTGTEATNLAKAGSTLLRLPHPGATRPARPGRSTSRSLQKPDATSSRSRTGGQAHVPSTLPEVWYKDGSERQPRANASLLKRHAGRFHRGRAARSGRRRGLQQLEEERPALNIKGVKLYAAESHENRSRGWKLTRSGVYRFLEVPGTGHGNIRAQGPDDDPLDEDASR